MVDYFRLLFNLRRPASDERGASAVEYGLLVAGIAAIIVAAVFLLGGTVSQKFNDTNNCVSGVTAAADCAPAGDAD